MSLQRLCFGRDITLSYILLSFTGVAHIGLSRCKKIKGGLVNLEYHGCWRDIIFLVTGGDFFCFNAFHNNSGIFLLWYEG